ncbi:MAG TPA: glycosyl hydrolase, partial [Blastocatellia bacterium]|nr:glycosyl hydrolase [Blastocatellia bacterium]
TLTELFNEHFLAPLHDWSRRNRTRLRVQGYGLPAVALSSNAHADLIEGEGHQWKRLSSTRWASSASHIYGRMVTSSETWTWLHSPSFRATPLDMKAEADRHFLQGINQLIGHGWPYTAEGVEYPGWRFYAAGVFNEKNPWWIVMPDVSRYLQRLSFLLRQGRPANDVAIYLPNDDAWSQFKNGSMHLIEILRERLGPDIVPGVLEAGYGFDFFDDDAFKQVGRVEGGALWLGPNRYRVVILPNVEQIPLDTLERFEELARNGGILIATRRTPALSPGFLATDADHEKIRDLSRRLFEAESAPAHFVKEERVELAHRLHRLLQPDVAFSAAAPEIGFIHRSAGDAEIYFLANTSNRARSVKATFRVQGMNPEWWDPFTGNVSPANVESRSEAGLTVPLDLEPYGSRVLVFTRRALPRTEVAKPTAVPPPIDLSAGWRVSFGQGYAPVYMDSLRSWTEDEKTRYFSGAATYERMMTVPEGLLQQGIALRLDFGEGRPLEGETYGPPGTGAMHAELEGPVREAAVVYINDRRAGSVWCPPYSLDVTGLLRPGENSIRIAVANTAMNHMAGRALPDYRLLNLRHGERFQAQHMDKVRPITSGLLGPVRLIPKASTGEHR